MGKIYDFATTCKKNIVGKELYYYLNKIGILNVFRLYEFHQRKKKYVTHLINPTNEMLEAKKFYSDSERINNVSSLLFDEKSRIVLQGMINFRITHNFDDFPPVSEDDQYFPKEIVEIKKDEVFVDCGAYMGDTERVFYHLSKKIYNKIVCFEPESDNFSALKKHASNHKNVVLIKKGVWNITTSLHFAGESASGKIEENVTNGIVISVVALDDVVECKDATFIKMDIEGAEYNALLGMRNIIKNNRPKLAICIYHSDEDMLRLIELVHSFDSNYKLYVRQHCRDYTETVLYAIP